MHTKAILKTVLGMAAIVTSSSLFASCEAPSRDDVEQPARYNEATPPAMPTAADNPTTPEKVALGHQLYYETRLSADGTRSCYSCHVCEHGLTDGKPVAEGALGKVLTRSSPSLWNIGYHTEFYWDGRAPSLERQAMAAWTGANLGADNEATVAKLNAIEGYREQFRNVFGEDVTAADVVKAINA